MEKQIKDFPDYYIHSDGYVISRKHGKHRKMINGCNGKGYSQVTLRHNGIQVKRYIHRLVAENFVQLIDGCSQINHIDGNKLNNSASNLEWVSAKENMAHAVKNGLWTSPTDEHYKSMRKQACVNNALFSLEEASDILEMKGVLKLSCAALAKIIGCSKTAIQKLANGQTTHFKNGVLA